jgi:hypothetical protein
MHSLVLVHRPMFNIKIKEGTMDTVQIVNDLKEGISCPSNY